MPLFSKNNTEDTPDLQLSETGQINYQEMSEITPIQPTIEANNAIENQSTNQTENQTENQPENQTESQPTQSTQTPVQGCNDGVFSNTVPLPIGTPPKYEEEEEEEEVLPTYAETTSRNQSLFVRLISAQEGEICYDGVPVGSSPTFFVSLMLTLFFGIIGFFCVYLMSHTHAGRCGARAGLGLIVIHFGVYMHKYLGSPSYWSDNYWGEENEQVDNHDSGSFWLSYFFIFIGWFSFVRAIVDYHRIKRIAQELA